MSAYGTPDRSRRSQAPTPPSNSPSRDISTPPRSLRDPREMYEELAEIEERLEDVEIDTCEFLELQMRKLCRLDSLVVGIDG